MTTRTFDRLDDALTVGGEFVIKNLVLLSAGVVVGATVRGRDGRENIGYGVLPPA